MFAIRKQLSLSLGGTKTNEQYPLMLQAIEQYKRAGQFASALGLLQAYSEHIYSETRAFQDRYGFSVEWFATLSGHMRKGRFSGPDHGGIAARRTKPIVMCADQPRLQHAA